MNQRPTGLNVSKAITGFLQYKSAVGLSRVTVSGYARNCIFRAEEILSAIDVMEKQ